MRTRTTWSMAVLLLAMGVAAAQEKKQPPKKTKPPVKKKIEVPKELVPALVAALKDTDRDVRQHAQSALVSLGDRAVPVLVEALKGTDKESQIQAAGVLAYMSSLSRRNPEVIPALLKMLKDKDAKVRRAAAQTLNRLSVGLR